MIIKNANIYREDNRFEKGHIYINGEYFSDELNSSNDVIIDANNYYAIPGLIDIHFHGCVGYDFCDGTHEAIAAISNYQAKNGITTIIPATMTLDEKRLLDISYNAASYKNECGAELVGIYMEGPFISYEKKGAQNELYIQRPNVNLYNRLQEASNGLFKVVAVAPEVEGAMEFIELVKDEIIVSIAHSSADYETARIAMQNGAKQITHMYNAMPAFNHRSPSIIGAAFDNEECMVEMICDGVHIHPSVIRATFKMFGDDRIILVSDSMMATGMDDGIYELGGQKVKVENKKATLLESDTIAGSSSNLMDCIKYLVKNVNIPLSTAIKCATKNPARAIGIYDKYGSIESNKYANLVLLDEDLNVVKVIIKGKIFQ